MIEIKNKRMILFREDRLIGAACDADTLQKKFILDAVQGETDLRSMVAWIKIDPKFADESPYDQMLKKEISDDKIILTWKLTAKNLQRAGEISAQIIFASPEYFIEEELGNIPEDSLILPSQIAGVSAPVWQSYSETFVIEESIDGTVGYKELTKNVLVSAVAEAVLAAENAKEAAESAQTTLESVKGAERIAGMSAEEAAASEKIVSAISNDVEKKYAAFQNDLNEIEAAKQEIYQNLETYRECVELVDGTAHKVYNYMQTAQQSSLKAEQNAKNVLDTVKKAREFRLIYSKTLSAEDTDCYSFEITEDQDGNPFLLSEFVAYMYFPMMTDMGSSYVKVNILPDDSTVSSYQNLCQFAAFSKTKNMYIRSEHKNMGRWVTKMVSSTSWNQNAETLRINGSIASASEKTNGKSAVSIRISQHADVDVPFPEGTMIEIWGVNSIKEAE